MRRSSLVTAFAAAAALGLAATAASAGTPPLQKCTACNGPHKLVQIPQKPVKPPIYKPQYPIQIAKPNHPHPGPHPWPHRPPSKVVYVAPVVAAGVATVAATTVATAPAPVACLTKEYTPTGAVLFRDICTSEWAMNPPNELQQSSGLVTLPNGQ